MSAHWETFKDSVILFLGCLNSINTHYIQTKDASYPSMLDMSGRFT